MLIFVYIWLSLFIIVFIDSKIIVFLCSFSAVAASNG